jgi:manganese/zinc/iron transport system substrate-binding protein
VPTFAVLEQIDRERLMPLPDLTGHYDPHLWMDVGLWAGTIDGVTASMAEAVPDCADDMRARAQAYSAQLVALDEWARASLASIPDAQRAMVTAHDAFNYFGRAYRVDVRGIQGVSTESEASVNAIRDMVSFIVSRRIPAIFVESSVNPRNIEAVRAAARARGWEVGLGEQLFSDAMGEGGTWQGTYIGMIRHNVRSVVTALGGQVAPWPDELADWSERFGLQES